MKSSAQMPCPPNEDLKIPIRVTNYLNLFISFCYVAVVLYVLVLKMKKLV